MRVTLILISLFVWAACSQQSNSGEEAADERSSKEKNTDKAVLHKDSELAAWMKTMHEQMFAVRESLEKGEPVPDSIDWNWEAIYEADRKNDDARGETFNGMARAFLLEMEKSLKHGDTEAYNHAVRYCVNCHENYCPGPIPKIEKLKINS